MNQASSYWVYLGQKKAVLYKYKDIWFTYLQGCGTVTLKKLKISKYALQNFKIYSKAYLSFL